MLGTFHVVAQGRDMYVVSPVTEAAGNVQERRDARLYGPYSLRRERASGCRNEPGFKRFLLTLQVAGSGELRFVASRTYDGRANEEICLAGFTHDITKHG